MWKQLSQDLTPAPSLFQSLAIYFNEHNFEECASVIPQEMLSCYKILQKKIKNELNVESSGDFNRNKLN